MISPAQNNQIHIPQSMYYYKSNSKFSSLNKHSNPLTKFQIEFPANKQNYNSKYIMSSSTNKISPKSQSQRTKNKVNLLYPKNKPNYSISDLIISKIQKSKLCQQSQGQVVFPSQQQKQNKIQFRLRQYDSWSNDKKTLASPKKVKMEYERALRENDLNRQQQSSLTKKEYVIFTSIQNGSPSFSDIFQEYKNNKVKKEQTNIIQSNLISKLNDFYYNANGQGKIEEEKSSNKIMRKSYKKEDYSLELEQIYNGKFKLIKNMKLII